jgi:uncharacterized membrane protein (UPF0127 family)
MLLTIRKQVKARACADAAGGFMVAEKLAPIRRVILWLQKSLRRCGWRYYCSHEIDFILISSNLRLYSFHIFNDV